MNPFSDLEIEPALPSERSAALNLLFAGDLSPEPLARHVADLLAETAPDAGDFDGLIIARRGGSLAGVVWVRSGGTSAQVVPPRTTVDAPSSTANRLLAAATAWIDARTIRFAQAVASTPTSTDAARLRRAGFEHVADLMYLMALERSFPASEPSSRLAFEPCSSDDKQRLASIVQATYEESCDCARLTGMRSAADMLADYEHATSRATRHWLVVRYGQHAVGCLLWADQPDASQAELVYMGLVPSARGRGHGLEIVERAQWLTRQAGRSRLVAAVDVANRPAIDMYAAAGFTAWDRKSVFARGSHVELGARKS